jgi:shikimate dehydrogenase
MPHKVTIMPHLDRIDPVALEIGAVNTVINDDGVLSGFNVDWLGAMRALEEGGVHIAGKRAYVIGAGGAARAVAFGLRERGAASVSTFNCTPDKAYALADSLGLTCGGGLDALLSGYDILVHTTSAGYVSQPGVCIVPERILEPGKVGYGHRG